MNGKGRTRITFAPRVAIDPWNSERTPKLLSILSDRYDVVTVPRSGFSKIIYDQKVNKTARYLLFPFDLLLNLIATIRATNRNESRLIWCEGTYFAVAGCFAAKLMGVCSVWDNHGNIWSLSRIQEKSGFFRRANVLVERVLASIADRIVVVSKEEQEIYAIHGFPREKFFILPTCADLDIVDSRRMSMTDARASLGLGESQRVILFFGTLSYEPNLQAASYIVHELAPSVCRERKDVMFYIAGSGTLPGEITDNVRLLGFVPNLQIWLSASDICIAPLWKGVGILTKVVDSLSTEKATVVTPLALGGMPELENGINCLVGSDPAEFKAQVERLIDDVDSRASIAASGRELIEREYAWSVHAPRLYGHLDALISEAAHDRS
jgi:glycosyltransferase involved in cell wall biosynthesis